jgi:hypothetical protein
MSPQAPAAPAATTEKTILDAIGEIDANERTSAEKQILRAAHLERERASLMKQIASNREYLRLMADNDELSNEQEDWLGDFYPEKEKGQTRTSDEVEATRKAKAAARK